MYIYHLEFDTLEDYFIASEKLDKYIIYKKRDPLVIVIRAREYHRYIEPIVNERGNREVNEIEVNYSIIQFKYFFHKTAAIKYYREKYKNKVIRETI